MNLKDCWGALTTLQRNLKKEFLLVEKEQQEKVKLKREIEDHVRSYHRQYIQLHHPGGQLLKEEGFDNCYNFIKDVVVTLSTDYSLGKLILFLCQENSTLPSFVIHGLYENLQTNDPFSMEVTRLIFSLLQDIVSSDLEVVQKEKIIAAWKLYVQKIQRQAYFQQIADPVIKKILRQEQALGSLSKQKKNRFHQFEKNNHIAPLETANKDQLLSQLLNRIQAQAISCPSYLNIPLRALLHQKSTLHKEKIWKLISYFYISPFLKVANHPELPTQAKERVLEFVDELVRKWAFTGELTHKSLECKQISCDLQASQKIEKIINKLIDINQARMNDFLQGTAPSKNEIQIKIYGGCLNFIQLYELLTLIHGHREAFSKINERVVTRTHKILQISPNLQIMHREKPGLLFVSLSQLRYQESISSDYYANYTIVYRGQTLKQMLKQVLVQIQNLSDLRTEHKNTLSLIFKSLANQHDRNGVSIPAQLLMKIKYLVFLLQKHQSEEETELMEQMLADLQERDSTNIKLYQDTKFSLLKVYCNLRNLKNHLRHQKEVERRMENKINVIRKLESLKLDICLTSKASRNASQIQEDHLDKYRYRLASADQILIQPVTQCIHKQNAFTGRLSHPHTITKFLETFAGLSEVRHYIKHPSFISHQQTPNPYLYCNQGKIGSAFAQFIQIISQKLQIASEEKHTIESIMLRSLHELLLQNRQYSQDCPRRGMIGERQTSKQHLEGRASPRKRGVQIKRRRGSFSQQEQPVNSLQLTAYQEQLHTMGKRYLQTLFESSTPSEKMRKLRDIIDIYKIALGKGAKSEHQRKATEELINKLLLKTVLSAKLPNLIGQLAFIEIFLSEEKLMSADGKVLKQFQKATVRALREGGPSLMRADFGGI